MDGSDIGSRTYMSPGSLHWTSRPTNEVKPANGTSKIFDEVTAQLQLEKDLHLETFTASGVGEVQSTLASTVHIIFLFVNASNKVLSLGTEDDVEPGAPSSYRDRICLIQHDLRSVAGKV